MVDMILLPQALMEGITRSITPACLCLPAGLRLGSILLGVCALPFENESNDKVWVDFYSPVTLLSWRVRLRIVW